MVFNQIVSILKWVGGFIAFLIVIFGGYHLYKFFFPPATIDTGGSDDMQNVDIKDVVVDNGRLSGLDTKYTNVADSLYKILQGNMVFDWAKTDADFIEVRRLLNLNSDEKKQVYKVYGLRKNKQFLIEFGDGRSLTQALYAYFKYDNDKLTKIKSLFDFTGLW